MNLPSPTLPEFEYQRVEKIEDALEALEAGNGSVRPLLGGTDLFVQLRAGHRSYEHLLDLKRIPEISECSELEDGSIRIGAGMTMNAVAVHPNIVKHYPILVEAALSVASYQLRNRATIGGNLCNASPAADTAPACLVMDARMQVVGLGGEQQVPIEVFFQGPGETALKDAEILAGIDLPPPQKGTVGRYLKLGRNSQGDLAIVGVAALVYPDKESTSGYTFRIALGSVAPTPIRVREAEAILMEGKVNEERITEAAKAAQSTAKPIDDVRASGRYRSEMVRILTQRALTDIWTQVQ